MMIKKNEQENIGLNLGPKTSSEMTSIGIKSLAQIRKIGWEKVFRKLIARYPERLNLNMASALIGAELGIDWRKIPRQKKEEAKALIKALKPKKQVPLRKTNVDLSFVDYIIYDQLSSLDIEASRMFGAHGLYLQGKFVAIIHDGTLFLKTNEKSSKKFIEAGMEPFKPTQKQTLKRYYQVPLDVSDGILWSRTCPKDLVQLVVRYLRGKKTGFFLRSRCRKLGDIPTPIITHPPSNPFSLCVLLVVAIPIPVLFSHLA